MSELSPDGSRSLDARLLDPETKLAISLSRCACLTPAELDVARSVAAGWPSRAIADARHVSVRTVANQVANIFRKVRVGSRVELATLPELRPATSAESVDWTELGSHERAVLERAAQGVAQKVIAIEVGRSASTVSEVLKRLRERFGFTSLTHLGRAYRAHLHETKAKAQ